MYDVLVVIDPRFPGGTSTSSIAELKALAGAFPGRSIAIGCIRSPLFTEGAPLNPAVEAMLAATGYPIYDLTPGGGGYLGPALPEQRPVRADAPLQARLALVHNPHVAAGLGALPEGGIEIGLALIVAHQPYLDGDGIPYYAMGDVLGAMGRHARRCRIVPIGPLSRANLAATPWLRPWVAGFDWPNVFAFSRRRRQPLVERDEPLTIGRHSRADWVKWPESAEAMQRIYQAGTDRPVRFLGWGAHLDRWFPAGPPSNWSIAPFSAEPIAPFLRSIDLFVYYHHPNWVEGFGRTIPEALDHDVPCLIDPAMRPTFGGLCLYAEPHEVGRFLNNLDQKREALRRFVGWSRKTATRLFGQARVTELYEGLFALADSNPGLDWPAEAIADLEVEFGERQRKIAAVADRGFELQSELGLMPPTRRRLNGKGDALAVTGTAREQHDAPMPQHTLADHVVDIVFCIDFRSARSDVWRVLELAEAYRQTGVSVALVHLETSGKADLRRPTPLLDSAHQDIRVFTPARDDPQIIVKARHGLVIAGPHLLVGEEGDVRLVTPVRLSAPRAVILHDKRRPAEWYGRAHAIFTAVFGCPCVWMPVEGANLSRLRLDVPSAEHVLPTAFVARRPMPSMRDLKRFLGTDDQFRVGRIGLMDASQWMCEDGTPVEAPIGRPILAYGLPTCRLTPAPVADRDDFFPFQPSQTSFEQFLLKVGMVSYFPTEKPSDLQLIPILRAAQSGALPLVAGRLKPVLGEAALYARPDEIPATVESYAADRSRLHRTALTKARAVAVNFGPDLALKRLDAALEMPARSSASGRAGAAPAHPSALTASSANAQGEVLFFSSNGVGLGHLTRLMAIARRLEAHRPVFLTMSQAFDVVRASGWEANYLPFHEVAGCDIADWNEWLGFHLSTVLRQRPGIRAVVFDGSNPYSGLMAINAERMVPRIWIQRGMWRKGHLRPEHVDRGKTFDMIIEPTDIAESLSTEEVASPAFDKVKVPPISLLEPSDKLSRREARRKLGLPAKGPIALIHLGSGTNRDIIALVDRIVSALSERGIAICVAEWIMGSEIPRIWPEVTYLRVFPLARYYNAFDFSIAAAGYNSFHEVIGAGLPTIFISNDNITMDDQGARALFAMQNDAALRLMEEDVDQIGGFIDIIVSSEAQAVMREACEALAWKNGADEAASLVDNYAMHFAR